MRVLLVDDEPGVLRLLLKLTSKIKPDWEMDFCHNAFDAQKKLSEFSFDLLVTDINLPVMSGLDLAKWTVEHSSQTLIIIVSGYSDFDYARTAMGLGIKHYLLKPVEEELYTELLNDLEANFLKATRQSKNDVLKQSLMNLPNSVAELNRETAGSTKIGGFENSQFLLLVLSYASYHTDLDDPENKKLKRLKDKEVEQHFKLFLHKSEDCWQFDSLYGSLSVIITLAKSASQMRSKELLGEIGEWAKANPPVIVVSSDLLNSPSDLTKYQKKILKSFGQYTNLMGGELLALNDVATPIAETLLENWKQQYHHFWKASFDFSFEELGSRWKRIILEWKEAKLRQAQCNLEIDRFCHSADTYHSSALSTLSVCIFIPLFKSEYANACSWAEFEEQSLKALSDFIADFSNKPHAFVDKHSQTVSSIKRYLEEHFHENINMNDLAVKYGYSPSYLSHIFRGQMDLSPLEYVNELRIVKAKYLLEYHPAMTNLEIAEDLGFSDASYFSRVFKKSTGQAPSRYRQTRSRPK